jgi:hypothetical protein
MEGVGLQRMDSDQGEPIEAIPASPRSQLFLLVREERSRRRATNPRSGKS